MQREASIYGTSFAIVLALGRSFARALWQFLPERRKMRHRKQSLACPKFCQELLLSAAISVLYVLVFCLKAHAQPDIGEPFGFSTVPAAETAMAATWKELLVEINNDLSSSPTVANNRSRVLRLPPSNLRTSQKKANDMKGWLGLGTLIEQQTLQSGYSIRLTQMTNGDHPWQSSQGAVATANTMQY